MTYSFTAPEKDPQAALFYQMDWTAWLEPDATITSQIVTSADTDLLISEVNEENGRVTWKAAGGVHACDYLVTVAITTSDGQEDHRTVRFPVREQ